MPIRVVIAEDHGVMRAGLRALLEDEPSVQVLAVVENGGEALRLAAETQPDLVLLDIEMPGMGGIEATRQLKAAHPEMKVLILSVYEDGSLLREALAAGAGGYMIKRAAEEELIAAIHAVSRGDIYIHPAMTHFLLEDLAPQAPKKSSQGKWESVEPITRRELEVMRYIIRGYTNRQVAEALSISVRTVENHRASLFGKLGLKNRVELIEYAEKNGFA